MRQYMEIKDNYDDTIIFFRLGDFYEMFFEDATLCSQVLELTLTGKQAGLEKRVPMCGVPHKAYAGYVDALIEKGYKVAICEQMEDPKETKGMVKREVVQVVTKGTRLDEGLDSKSNNYIASLYYFDYCYGVAFSDVSTGEVNTFLIDNDLNRVVAEIVKWDFKEVIVNSKVDRKLVNILRSTYNIFISFADNLLEDDKYDYIYHDISDIRLVSSIKHLLCYIVDTKKSSLLHLQKANLITADDRLQFDVNTEKNLELIETIRKNDRMYSLFWLLDKAKTAIGSRFIKHSILNPLTNKKEINRRLDIVSTLSTSFILRDDLINELSSVYDLERLVGRISYGNLNAKDLIQLKNSLAHLPGIAKILEELKYDKKIERLEELYLLLDKSINEDAPLTLHEGDLIKEGYNKELDELKNVSTNSKDFLLEIENKERKRTGIKNLKVGYNKVFGYYIEVTRSQKHLIKDEYGYERRQTLSNSERFITPELKEKEQIILTAEEKIINLEYKLFMDICEVVKRYIDKIQKNAKIIGEIDMLQAFSILADNNNYVRPEFTDNHEIEIVEARHPVVEHVLTDGYVANDIIMDKDTNILLITGPNMAGKSTYMRQCALIAIMAQMGSFVPCKSCKIPIFDRIFTRIGASDDLVSGESTFMVEMKEACFAIKNATKNSLILFDELGRGTATYDGMALAQAILEYIHNKVQAKTLFSTHYHELTSLDKRLKHLKNIHVTVKEEKGNITFLHKIADGSVDKSYGLHVGKLAGLPNELIKRSKEILDIYEKEGNKTPNTGIVQTNLFDESINYEMEQNNYLEEKIRDINPLEMTPLDALTFLAELKEEVEKE